MIATARPAPPPPPSSAALLLLPLSVLADGALFWPAACLVALGAALERRHGAMLVWYGLAIGFDAQALLLAPFFGAVLIGRRVPLSLLPLAPACIAAMRLAHHAAVPAWSLPQDLAVSNGAPNIWAIAQALPWIGELPLTGLALTTAFGAAVAYCAWVSARPLRRDALLDAALLCTLVMPGLLPALAARAFFPAAGLALLIALVDPRPARWRVALLVALGTCLAIAAGAGFAPLGAAATLVATALQARAVLKPAANDNPLMARTA